MAKSHRYDSDFPSVVGVCETPKVEVPGLLSHPWLSEPERSRAARLLEREAEKRFLCGRLMLKEVLSELSGKDPAEIELASTEKGQPFVVGSELSVSVSYSDGLVAAAVAVNGPIGVDVEIMSRRLDPSAIAALAFPYDDQAHLASLEGDTRRREFLALWVRREAVAKALGEGLRPPIRTMDLRRGIASLDCRIEPFTVRGAWLGCLVLHRTIEEVSWRTWRGPGQWGALV